LGKNRNFGQKSKFWPKIEILATNRNFGQKSKFWPKIEILVTKEMLVKNSNSGLGVKLFQGYKALESSRFEIGPSVRNIFT